MSEKQGAWEGVYDVALQDPCDMVKAILPEPQSPVVEPHTHRYHAWEQCHHERAVRFCDAYPSCDGR